jgi:hypothetical protein
MGYRKRHTEKTIQSFPMDYDAFICVQTEKADDIHPPSLYSAIRFMSVSILESYAVMSVNFPVKAIGNLRNLFERNPRGDILS